MTRRRWIADQVNGESASLLGDHAAHLARVLRAKVGEEYDIAINVDNQSRVRRGKITSISDNRVDFALGDVLNATSNVAPRITLALAIFKFDRMEWALEKCTEIGVAHIIPVIARRSDSHLAAASIKRHDRWQRIVSQARTIAAVGAARDYRSRKTQGSPRRRGHPHSSSGIAC